MPVISSFYGITIYLFTYDKDRHHLPHIHIRYGEFNAGIDITRGKKLYGDFPRLK